MLGITSDEMYERMLAAEKEKVEKLAGLWEQIDGLQDKILEMTEDELKAAFGGTETAARLHSYDEYSHEYILDDRYNKRNWYNYGGWCGPNVVAFIMLGLGTKSGYKNIPTVDASYWLEQKVLWWTVKINYWNEGEYYIHDNGVDAKEGWWEGESLYHFQAANVVNR